MSTALARKFRIDVTTDLTLAGGWEELMGIQDFTPTDTPHLEDASAYDTNGSASMEKTFEEWTATATVMRRVNSGVYDAGQELVRSRTVGKFGDECRVGIRWYDKDGGPEAYQGVAIVTWARSQSGVRNLDAATITFTGTDIPLEAITNPGTAPTAPVVTSATPSNVAAGGQVTISGSGFTDTLATGGVKFGGISSSTYTVVSDQTIVAVMPAGSAGSAVVTVTNAEGASNALPYTRG